MQSVVEELEAAGVTEFGLYEKVLSSLDDHLSLTDHTTLLELPLYEDAQEVQGGAPIFLFVRGLEDAIRGSRGAEDIDVRNGAELDSAYTVPTDKACGLYEFFLWGLTPNDPPTMFQAAIVNFKQELKTRGYVYREAETFNKQFAETAEIYKDFIFGPSSARQMLKESAFSTAKSWSVETSYEENIAQDLIKRFENAESKRELVKLVAQLPEPEPPVWLVFSVEKNQDTFAGLWASVSTVDRKSVPSKGFSLTLCKLDRDRWDR